jgi:hypothetical protein
MATFNFAKIGKIVADVHCECNRNVLFWPLSRNLFSEKKMTEERNDSIPGWWATVGGVIPGHRIEIDFKTRKGKLIDKVFLKENAAILKSLRDLRVADFDSSDQNRFRVGADGENPIEFTVPEGDEATFLYHMANLVKTGRLLVQEGEVPTSEQCKQMGRCKFGEVDGTIAMQPGFPSPWYSDPKPEEKADKLAPAVV